MVLEKQQSVSSPDISAQCTGNMALPATLSAQARFTTVKPRMTKNSSAVYPEKIPWGELESPMTLKEPWCYWLQMQEITYVDIISLLMGGGQSGK